MELMTFLNTSLLPPSVFLTVLAEHVLECLDEAKKNRSKPELEDLQCFSSSTSLEFHCFFS